MRAVVLLGRAGRGGGLGGELHCNNICTQHSSLSGDLFRVRGEHAFLVLLRIWLLIGLLNSLMIKKLDPNRVLKYYCGM